MENFTKAVIITLGAAFVGGYIYLSDKKIQSDEKVQLAEAKAKEAEANKSLEETIHKHEESMAQLEADRARWASLSEESKKEIYAEKEANRHDELMKTLENDRIRLEAEILKAKSKEVFSDMEKNLRDDIISKSTEAVTNSVRRDYDSWKSDFKDSVNDRCRDMRRDISRLQSRVDDCQRAFSQRVDGLVDRTVTNAGSTTAPTTIINNRND